MIICAKIHPKSKQFKVIKKSRYWEIYLTQPAKGNKANLELIKKIKKCKILKGKNSKTKILEIQ